MRFWMWLRWMFSRRGGVVIRHPDGGWTYFAKDVESARMYKRRLSNEELKAITGDGGHCRSECPKCKMSIYVPNTSRGTFIFPCQHGTPDPECPYKDRIGVAASKGVAR